MLQSQQTELEEQLAAANRRISELQNDIRRRSTTLAPTTHPVSNASLPFVFSERSLYAIARPSVVCLTVCLSVVCNVRAPYSAGSNFRQYFYGIKYCYGVERVEHNNQARSR